MKLIYISPLRYPGEKAGSLFSVKSCEAFAQKGIAVELWVPKRFNHLTHEDVYEYFGVSKDFKIKRFFVLDLMPLSSSFFGLVSLSFAVSVFVYGLFLKLFSDVNEYVFYSHEQIALLFLTLISSNTFYEAHDFPKNNKIQKVFFKRVSGIISTNNWKTSELKKLFHISNEKIFTTPNAVDLKHFLSNVSIVEARKKLGIEENGFLIGYVGALKTMGMEKGINVAIDSLKFLSAEYKLYIVGGEQGDIDYYNDYLTKSGLSGRVVFAGSVPHNDVSLYMSACNCLIAPYPNTEHYRHYMSPMKVFEYMAGNRPIIATDLPSIREILKDGETAVLVPPDDSRALAGAVERLMINEGLSSEIAIKALGLVEDRYTWSKRADRIVEFLRLREKHT